MVSTSTTTSKSSSGTTTTSTTPFYKTYKLPGGANGRIFLFGPRDAKTVLFFCPGIPDDCLSSFGPLATKLSATTTTTTTAKTTTDDDNNNNNNSGGILCGVTCLPGYDYWSDTVQTFKEHNYKVDGYTFDDWVSTLREAYKVLNDYSTNTNAQYIGIFHDLGVVAGAMFTNRESKEKHQGKQQQQDETLTTKDTTTTTTTTVSNNNINYYYPFHKIIYMDVLPPPHPSYMVPLEINLYKFAVEVSYRSFFALLWILYRYLPLPESIVSIIVTIVFGILYTVLKLLHLFPTIAFDNITNKERRKNDQYINLYRCSYMTYPYYSFMKGLVTGTLLNDLYGYHLPKHDDNDNNINGTIPILYMYGTVKNINFHDTTSIQYFNEQYIPASVSKLSNARSCSKIVPINNAGHWFYLQQHDETYDEIIKFISI